MKKLLLAVMVAGLAVAANAGDAANKDQATCNKDKAAMCPASKAQCSASTAAKKETGKKIVHSPRGEQQANKS